MYCFDVFEIASRLRWLERLDYLVDTKRSLKPIENFGNWLILVTGWFNPSFWMYDSSIILSKLLCGQIKWSWDIHLYLEKMIISLGFCRQIQMTNFLNPVENFWFSQKQFIYLFQKLRPSSKFNLWKDKLN